MNSLSFHLVQKSPVRSVCGDAFVAEINPSGTALIYSTFLGGSGEDSATGVAVDSKGNIYVSGGTNSMDFPTTPGAVQRSFGGGSAVCNGMACGDAFLVKIKKGGASFSYATYVGGAEDDLAARGLAVDVAGNAYLAGVTASRDFPTTSRASQRQFSGASAGCAAGKLCGDAFLTIVDSTGERFLHSTYIGGSKDDAALDLALAPEGTVHIAGITSSGDFPAQRRASSVQPPTAGSQAFMVSFNPTGASCSITWVGPATGGDWSVAANWSTNALPAAADTVCIGAPNTVTISTALPVANQTVSALSVDGALVVNLNGLVAPGLIVTNVNSLPSHIASLTVGSNGNIELNTGTTFGAIDVNGGNLGGVGQFDLTGNLNWSGTIGLLSPTCCFGAPDFNVNGNINGGGFLNTRNLNLTGMATSSSIFINGFGTVTINPGSTMMGGGVSTGCCFINNTTKFVNNGTFVTSGFNMFIAFTNTGTFEIQSGLMQGPSMDLMGATIVDAGATLQLVETSSHTSLNFTGSLQGQGTLELRQNVVNIACSPCSIGTLLVDGANFVSGSTWTVSNPVQITSGSFFGNPTINGNINQTGGFLGGLTLNGDYQQGGGGELDVLGTPSFIAAPPAGAMIISGTATIAGLLGPGGCVPCFVPTPCTSTIALQAASIVGMFSRPLPNQSPVTSSWTLTYTPTTVVLIGNPIPITVSPSTLAFGNQQVSTTSPPQVVTVTNQISSPVNGVAPSFSGQNSADFTATNQCPNPLPGGATCTINITFNPLFVGPESATLDVNSNSFASPNVVALSGTGVAGHPVVSVAPSSLNFGNVVVGTTSSTQSVTVTNSTGGQLTIQGISLTGANPADFSQNNTCGTGLAAAASCTVTITFTPTLGAAESASLSIADNGPASPQMVSLTGMGILLPMASVAPSSLNFGSVSVGTTSSPQIVTLTNSGRGALQIQSVGFMGSNPSDFAQTNNCGQTLAANSNCNITVTFKPTTPALESATLVVTDNASPTTQTVMLSGTGTASPAVSLAPSMLSFGTLNVGMASPAQSLTLANNGNAALTIQMINFSGPNAADFSQTNNCAGGLAVGASCTINVTFQPSVAAAEAASLGITDNASGSPQMAQLSGSGAGFGLTPAAGTSTSATIKPGDPAHFSLTIAPTMGFTGTVTFSCSGVPPLSGCALSPTVATIGPGQPAMLAIDITTTKPSTIFWNPGQPPSLYPSRLSLLWMMTLLTLWLAFRMKQGPRSLRAIPLLALLLLTLIGAAACRGGGTLPPVGNPGTPAGNYNVTITGKSGTVTQTVNLTVNVT
ncbi:MAG: choice-of-anchor D domain-containing protein [Acidipila sp.]|nr:choice-of-anchor D domain-containing protein [Acidipila sp.]